MGTTSSAPSETYRRMVWWCTWRMPANSVSPWMPSRRCMPRRSSSTVASWTAAFGERSATHTTRRRPGCSRRGEEPGIGGLMAKLDLYDTLARQLRADSIRCSTAAGSGHPTSSLSAADLMAVLLAAPHHVWTLTGDSELAEGSIWEGLDHAGHERLANFTAIFDVNRLGQRGPTELEWNLDAYAARVKAFGCEPIVIDGHDLAAIDAALERARQVDRPTVIVAKTVKGRGVSFLENKEGWHGKALDREQARRALAEIGDVPSRTFPTLKPDPWQPPKRPAPRMPEWKTYREPLATRKAYGEALAALGAARADVVVLDGEVSNSTHAEDFKKTAAERFFEMYIAEQQMVAAAVGMQVLGLVPFASTFAAFMTRAFDFIRMAAISRASMRLCGSHAGVSTGA